MSTSTKGGHKINAKFLLTCTLKGRRRSPRQQMLLKKYIFLQWLKVRKINEKHKTKPSLNVPKSHKGEAGPRFAYKSAKIYCFSSGLPNILRYATIYPYTYIPICILSQLSQHITYFTLESGALQWNQPVLGRHEKIIIF